MTDPAVESPAARPGPLPLHEGISWVLRAAVAAGVVGIVAISLHHRLSPSTEGIPAWLFPLVPIISFAGPGALLLLVAEAILALGRRVRKRTLLLDAALVVVWLPLWFSFL